MSAQRKFEDVKETDYEHIESPDVFVKMDKVMEDGATVGIGVPSPLLMQLQRLCFLGFCQVGKETAPSSRRL